MKIYVINGAPRAGKDQFVEYCKQATHWCKNVSTVDFVKEVAAGCGWDGTKTPKNRQFLSDLKDLLTTWGDVPFKKVIREIELFKMEMIGYDFNPEEEGAVFIHCREPQEIAKFVREIGAKTLLIRRNEAESALQSNHADAEVLNYDYDYVIHNDGTLDELRAKAIAFLTKQGHKIS